jgi:hypothetical protein
MNRDEWRAMLQAPARFHMYSLNNVLLIQLQMPTATRVAGYRTWQALHRQVHKGETGIAILAPVTYKTKGEDRDDEEESTEVRQLRGFKVEHVFDPFSRDSWLGGL